MLAGSLCASFEGQDLDPEEIFLLVELPWLPWLTTTGWLIPTKQNRSLEIIGCRSFIKIVIYTSWHMAWEK